MSGGLFGYVHGHGDSVHALYGEPQRHEYQNKSDYESMHDFMLAVKLAKCKRGVLQADKFVLEFDHYARKIF